MKNVELFVTQSHIQNMVEAEAGGKIFDAEAGPKLSGSAKLQ
jgi:hypothetical protein